MSTPSRPLTNLLNSSGSLHPNGSSTSLISPGILALADPTPHSVDAHLFDLLLNETIRILVDSTQYEKVKRAKEQSEIQDDLRRLGFTDNSASTAPLTPAKGEHDERDSVERKVESIGFRLGYSTAERLSRDRPRFPSMPASTPPPSTSSSTPSSIAPPVPDTLELIKFVCKDLWVALFDKQVDNLRTNHRGVFVLLDNRLRFLERISGEKDQVDRWSRLLLKFPEGVIRGALANMGLQVTVTSESNNIPQASFQVKTTAIKP